MLCPAKSLSANATAAAKNSSHSAEVGNSDGPRAGVVPLPAPAGGAVGGLDPRSAFAYDLAPPPLSSSASQAKATAVAMPARPNSITGMRQSPVCVVRHPA